MGIEVTRRCAMRSECKVGGWSCEYPNAKAFLKAIGDDDTLGCAWKESCDVMCEASNNGLAKQRNRVRAGKARGGKSSSSLN
eukprot:167058-Alexandrium_andersonii.AAC.1